MRFMKSVALALTLAITAALTLADSADARRRHYHGSHFGTGVVIGLGTGLVFGSFVPRYGYGPGYYGYSRGYSGYSPRTYGYTTRYYAPRYYRPVPRVYVQSGGADWLRYCSLRYRSFNPHTGMFRGYDGRYHHCR